MNNIIIPALAIYLLAIGYKGNGQIALDNLGSDFKGFVPWGASIIILMLLAKNDTIKPVVGPFIGLALLATVLKKWPVINQDLKSSYNLLQGK